MKLIELEEQLERMREQGAHDNTPVRLWIGLEYAKLGKVGISIVGGNQGRRVVEMKR